MSVLDRSRPPAPGPVRFAEFPAFGRTTLSNRLSLRVCRVDRLPVVSATLFLRAGEGALPAERAGLAVLTGDALEGGTRQRSGTALAEALERLGIRLGVGVGWEGTSISFSCLPERLGEAMALLAEIVLEPAFPDDEVERARERRLARIRQRAMDPAARADDALMPRIFAPPHPYRRPVAGTEETVASFTRETLLGWAEAAYRPAGGGLVLVGDVDPAEAEELARAHLEAWTGAPPDADPGPPAAAYDARRVWVEDRPGSVQSEIRVGHLGAERTAPDEIPLRIANLIFGGMFTSRLNLNLRERHGFTYGVRSRFALRSRPGPFKVATAVDTGVTADAVREILSEMERFAAEGPTEEEVRAARDYAAGIFGVQLQTADDVAERILQILIYGLAEDYYDRYRDALRAVTVEETAGAARRRLRPEEAQIVVVGAADEVAEPLEKLGAGLVEVVS